MQLILMICDSKRAYTTCEFVQVFGHQEVRELHIRHLLSRPSSVRGGGAGIGVVIHTLIPVLVPLVSLTSRSATRARSAREMAGADGVCRRHQLGMLE